jgi:hypothetical protein
MGGTSYAIVKVVKVGLGANRNNRPSIATKIPHLSAPMRSTSSSLTIFPTYRFTTTHSEYYPSMLLPALTTLHFYVGSLAPLWTCLGVYAGPRWFGRGLHSGCKRSGFVYPDAYGRLAPLVISDSNTVIRHRYVIIPSSIRYFVYTSVN